MQLSVVWWTNSQRVLVKSISAVCCASFQHSAHSFCSAHLYCPSLELDRNGRWLSINMRIFAKKIGGEISFSFTTILDSGKWWAIFQTEIESSLKMLYFQHTVLDPHTSSRNRYTALCTCTDTDFDSVEMAEIRFDWTIVGGHFQHSC